MGAHIMFSTGRRRKLRRLLQHLLFPKATVRHYGFDPTGPLTA
jgi:hypothetical protein